MSTRLLFLIQVSLALASLLAGAMGLVGWLFRVQGLFFLAGSQMPLAFNSAVALVLFGLAVMAVVTGRLTFGRWLGVALFALGGAKVLQYSLGRNLGIEPLWMAQLYQFLEWQTGQMALFTAFTCVLLGSALFLATLRRRFPGAIIILTALVMADLVLVMGGHLINLEARSGWELLTGMAPFAAGGFLFGACSLLLWARQAVPERDRSTADALGILAVASMVMFGVGLAAWTSNETQGDSVDQASRSFEVIDSSNYAELCLTRMESAARGYTLSKQEPYVDYYNDIERRLLAEFRQLLHSVADNPAQLGRVEELVKLLNIKRAHMRQVIDRTRTGELEFKRETFSQPIGLDLMAAVRAKGNEIEQAERARLASWEARADGVRSLMGRVIVSGEILAGGLALVAFYFVRRTDRARLAAQDELRLANESLEQRVTARTAELQAAVSELVGRERSRRFLADSIPHLVWTALPDGPAETFNRSWCDYTGLTEHQSKTDGWVQVLHSADAAETFRIWQQVLSSGREGGGEYRLRRASDGAYRWMLWHAQPERNEAGILVRWVGTTTDVHDQKEVQAHLETLVQARTIELRESEERFRSSFDSAGIGMAIVALDGRWVRVNKTLCEIVGYPENELRGKTFQDITHPDDLGRDLANVQALIEGKIRTYQMEKRYFHRDGHVVWINLTASLVRDGAGAPRHFVSQIEDISVRKKLEAALRESEARLNYAQQTIHAGGWELDLRERTVTRTLEHDRIFGYESLLPEWTYEMFLEHVLPEDRTGVDRLFQEATAAQLDWGFECRIRRVDGEVRWIWATGKHQRDEDGQVRRMSGIVQDITERKRAELALAASEERLSNVFRSLADGLVLRDATGRAIECNAAAERMVGATREQMLGLNGEQWHSRWRAIREDGTEFLDDEFPSAVTLRTGQPQRGVIMGLRPTADELIWVSVNSEPIFGPDGKIQAVVASFADVTERKQLLDSLAVARDQALEGSRLKSEFLASMSHEIRTPMNGVMGMASLLLDTPLSAEQREMGVVIQNSAESLLKIINDILDFSKIEAGKMHIEPVDFDLRSLVEEVLTLLAPRAHEKHLELLCEIDDRLNRSLRGDAGRIRQVLLNLAGNAVKFTAAGEVLVAARWLREHNGRAVVRLEVTDTGIGIPATAQRQLFQPFMQADGSTTRRFGGTGLGLAISRQLVELMGGEIGFQSEEGRGSTFWVQLDLEERSATAKPRTLLAPGRRILVVDANIKSRRILTGHLAALGVQADTASDAAGAIDTLLAATAAGQHYDLVLLDHHLPDPGGLGLAREIRAQSAIAATPLILIAVTNAATDSPPFAAAGFAAQLTKPVREEQLYRALFRVWEEAPAPGALVTPSAAPDAQAKGAKLRMLVAEDNFTNQIVTRKFLERLGHTVDLAADGAEALAQLARQSYDVVLMDCQMPGMDGYTATKHIRSGEIAGVNPRIPVIALTAYAMPTDRQKCLDAGMDEYVAKPLRVAELTEALLHCGLQAGSTTAPAPDLRVAAESELLEPKQLEQLRSLPGLTDAPLLNDLVHLFLAETPAAMSRLGEQLDRRAAKEIAMTAHKLAGSCANLGARDLRMAALAIEKAARAEDWKEISSRVAVADREWLRLKFHLERLAADYRA